MDEAVYLRKEEQIKKQRWRNLIMKEKVIGFIKKDTDIMRGNDTCNGIRFF